MIAGRIGKFSSLKCSNCGSDIMFTQIKGNNTGLYCRECGKWQKWLSKNEKNLWNAPVDKTIAEKTKPASLTFTGNVMAERIREFTKVIENKVTKEMMEEPKSDEDEIRKCSYCLALEQCKTALENILADRRFDDN